MRFWPLCLSLSLLASAYVRADDDGSTDAVNAVDSHANNSHQNSAASVDADDGALVLETPRRTGPCAVASRPLDANVWVAKRIETFRVVNSLGAPADPKPVPANRAKFQICDENDVNCVAPDVVLNGAFHGRDAQGNPVAVAGATMRDGVVDPGASSQAYSHRGGLALLSDGRMVVCKPVTDIAVTNEVIQKNCASNGAQVVNFLGGGAYLVRNGYKACSGTAVAEPCDRETDLASAQNFHQSGDGIKAAQMRATLHGVIAMKQGQAYVLFSKRAVSGAMIQDQLCAAGFSEVLKYDGGSGYIAWGPGVARSVIGVNPTAFLIRTAK